MYIKKIYIYIYIYIYVYIHTGRYLRVKTSSSLAVLRYAGGYRQVKKSPSGSPTLRWSRFFVLPIPLGRYLLLACIWAREWDRPITAWIDCSRGVWIWFVKRFVCVCVCFCMWMFLYVCRLYVFFYIYLCVSIQIKTHQAPWHTYTHFYVVTTQGQTRLLCLLHWF